MQVFWVENSACREIIFYQKIAMIRKYLSTHEAKLYIYFKMEMKMSIKKLP